MGLLMCSIFSFVFTDMLFLQGSEAIFKVALSLLGSHKPLILQHENLETIVDFIKNTLPNLGLVQMEKTISQVWKNLNVWVICKEIIFFFNKFLAENSQQCIVLFPAEKNSVIVVLKMLKNFGSVWLVLYPCILIYMHWLWSLYEAFNEIESLGFVFVSK